MFNNHFMSWIRLCTKTELIAERARGNEERSAFSNHGGADFLEPVDGRIFSINVVTYIGIRHTVKRVTLEEPEDILFTEIDAPAGVTEVSPDEAAAAKVT